MIVGDLGGSPDIALRRAGPDLDEQDPYFPTPAPVDGGAIQIAPIYWQPFGTNGNFDADSGDGRMAVINARTRGTPNGTSRPGSLHLGTTSPGNASPTDRMVIRENGRVGIGTENPVSLLEVAGPISAQSSGLPSDGLLCFVATGTVFEIRKCSSSQRYKTAIKDLDVNWDAFMKLQPREFTWRDSGQQDIGFVAEEMEHIYPLLAVRNPDGSAESIKYIQMTALLTGVVQQQRRAIEQLEAQIAAMKRHSEGQ
jgi:hypothetical protein